jgi:hypothetical protein
MKVPGEIPDGDGNTVQIRRAWPRGDGSLIVEGREGGSGRIRAGRIDAGGRASMVPFCADPALPGLSSAAVSGDLLVHRLKRRAVVRSDGLYRKFIAGGKAAAVADAHLAAVARLAESGLKASDVVASDRHSVTLTAVTGVSLHDLGRGSGAGLQLAPALGASGAGLGPAPEPGAGDGFTPLDAWGHAWELWADKWPQFVGASVSAGSMLAARVHSAQDEVRTVERWVELTTAFDALGVSEDRLQGVAASATRSLLAGASPARPAHRDLHDKQILVDSDSGSVGIIDFDTLAVAEPALDLANLSVHLDFRVAQGLLSGGAAALGKQHIQRAAETLQVPDSRFEAYAFATALRLACIYAFRPPYRHVARAWFNAVDTRGLVRKQCL